MSAGHVGDTHGSNILSSAADVLGMGVFGLRWCGWYRWGVRRGLGTVGLCYVCVSCESGYLCR